MKRGEIHWASVVQAETKGGERFNQPGRPRPWVVLSTPRLYAREGLFIGCPLTSKGGRVGTSQNPAIPEHLQAFCFEIEPEMVVCTPQDQWDGTETLFLGHQIRVMAAARMKPGYSRLGALTPAALAQVENALLAVLGIRRT